MNFLNIPDYLCPLGKSSRGNTPFQSKPQPGKWGGGGYNWFGQLMNNKTAKSTLLADNTRGLITTKQTKSRPVASTARGFFGDPWLKREIFILWETTFNLGKTLTSITPPPLSPLLPWKMIQYLYTPTHNFLYTLTRISLDRFAKWFPQGKSVKTYPMIYDIIPPPPHPCLDERGQGTYSLKECLRGVSLSACWSTTGVNNVIKEEGYW